MKTILVVDDEPSILALLDHTLTAEGYTVLTATDGSDALHVGTQHDGTIHLLITDIEMPNMEGYVLAKHLCASRGELNVLFMSAHSKDELVGQGILASNALYVKKPFQMDDMLTMIQTVVGPEARRQT